MDEEVWKDVRGYEGKYAVSNMGRVKSLTRVNSLGRRVNERILRPLNNGRGYLKVNLCKGGEIKQYTIHRLVLSTFNPVENMESMQVNHKDEDPTNNNLNNLEWCTALYNLTYNYRQKRVAETQSIPIVQLSLDGRYIRSYKSSHDVERLRGFNQGAIIQCCKNKFNREGNNIYKGFIWQYLHTYIHNIDHRIKKIILFDKEYEF